MPRSAAKLAIRGGLQADVTRNLAIAYSETGKAGEAAVEFERIAASPKESPDVQREAVLSAVVAAEQITPSEEDLLGAVTPIAEREELEPEKLLEDLRSSGRLEELREGLSPPMATRSRS